METTARQVDSGSSPWRRLLRGSAVATIVVIAVVFAVSWAVIPPLLVALVLLGVGVLWLRRRGKAPVIFVGVVSTLLQLTNLPFAIPAFAHPDSALDFILIGAMTVTLLLSLIAAVAELWSRRAPGKTPRRVATAGVAIVGVFVVIGVTAAVTTGNDDAAAGDLTLGAKSVEWTTGTLTTQAGTIGVLVDNRDATRHDFKIDDVVAADLPASRRTRVTFAAHPGSYAFYCSIHPNMKGTMTVSAS